MLCNKCFRYKSLISFSIMTLIFFISCTKKIQIEKYLEPENKWQSFGYDSSRNFYIRSDLKLPLKQKWEVELEAGISHSSITSISNFVCVADLKGNVYFLNPEIGRILSKISLKQPILTSVIVRERDLIISLAETKNKKSQLVLYDLLNGKVKKTFEVEGSIERELVLHKDFLIATTTSGRIYSLKYDLNKIWEIQLNEELNCHPASSNNLFVTVSLKGNLFLVDMMIGKVLKKIKISSGVNSGISISNNLIYFGNSDGNFYCFTLDGSKVWQEKLKASVKAIPSIDDSSVFIGDLLGNVYAFDNKTGKKKWETSFGGMINNSILVLNNQLIVPDSKGFIYVLEKLDGGLVQKIELKGRVKFSPVLVKNKVFIGYDDKKIAAYEND